MVVTAPRVIVTGSSGFIGRHVVEILESQGVQVDPYDKPRDITDPSQPCWALFDGAAGVINLAGALGTEELFGAEIAAAQVNITGALRVFDAAAASGIPVVQIGTGHRGQLNPYAITKAAAEDLALARAQWHGERIAVVRAFHVYGPGQLPGAPYGPASVRKFFPAFACAAVRGEPLELCGGGQQVIDPVYVHDVAAVLCAALGGPYGEVIEAGAGSQVSVAQAAQDVIDAAGSDSCAKAVPGRVGEPPDAHVYATKPRIGVRWPAYVRESVGWYRSWLAGRP